MKVLHVIPSVGPWRGGPSLVVRTLTEGLAGRGIDAHIATTDDDGPNRLAIPEAGVETRNGVTYHFFRRNTRPYLISYGFARWFYRHVKHYDIVHVHTVFSFCSNYAAWLAGCRDVPYIVRPLGVLNRYGMQRRRRVVKQWSFAAIERRLLSRASVVHYTSQQERIEASELGFSHKGVVIPNPVMPPVAERASVQGYLRTRFPQLSGKRVVLFLSRLDRKKGLDLLVPAFARVLCTHPQTMLMIAGGGAEDVKAEAHRSAEALGISDSIVWAGFIDGREKFATLAEADLFVLPSYSENFGVAVVEAMQAGAPVVVSDQVGIHREIAAAHAGAVVRCDVEELTKIISELLADPPRLRAMGENGVQLARQFSADKVTDELVRCYTAIAPPLVGSSRTVTVLGMRNTE